jgi:iron(III) transport system substrate-binding protein
MKWILGAVAACLAAIGSASAQDLVLDHELIATETLLAAARQERRIVLYGTIPTESMSIALEQFTKDTGIAYEYIRLPTAKMYDRVLAEHGAGKLEADYVGLTDLSLIKAWAERGILARHKPPAFAELPADLRDDAGAWFYVVRPISTIAVNTEEVKDADTPKSWKDLLDPKWKGKIGMPSMDAGGSALTLYAFLRLKVAPDYWPRLAANEPRIYATAAPVVNDLVRGRTAVGLSGASSYLQQIENKAPVKIVFPAEGLAAFGEIGNVTAAARHPNAARLYMNWILSARGSAMVSRQGSYGTHPGAPPPSQAGYAFPPPGQVWTIGPADWEKYQERWPREWKEIFERK